MHPLTDIVCLTHNRLNITQIFIDRIFQFTENFNLIFVDNGSTDGTVEFLEKEADKKWKLIKLKKNTGVIKGRNIGAENLNKDVPFFVNLDNDQHPKGQWLQSLHNVIEKGYDIVGVEAWKLQKPQSGGTVMLNNKPHSMDYFPIRRCKRRSEEFTYVGCGGMLIKKKVYDTVGLFDERFSPAYYEDPDLVFRSIQAGFRIGWDSRCPLDHLGHQTIATQKLFDKNIQFRKSWNEFKKKWKDYYPEPTRMK